MSKLRGPIYFQVGALLLLVTALGIAGRFFPIADWIANGQQAVMHLGSRSAIWFAGLYLCCNVLLLPGGFLSVGGGFFFGLWWGFLIVLIANVSAAGVSFSASRWVAQRWLRPKLSGNAALAALSVAVEQEGWKIVLLSQLNPLFPTSLLNYLYGLTAIRFRTFIAWVAIGQAPGLFLYSYLGTLGQLSLNLIRGKSHPRLLEYYLWGGGLVLSVVTMLIIGRISLRLLQQTKNKISDTQVPDNEITGPRSLSACPPSVLDGVIG